MKKINNLLEFLNENFSESIEELDSSLHLLQDQIEEIDRKIAESMNKLMINNEYNKAREYLQKSEELSGFILNIENIVELISNNENNNCNEKVNNKINEVTNPENKEINNKEKELEQEKQKEVNNNEVININYDQLKKEEKKEQKEDVIENNIAHFLSNDLKNREPLAFYIYDEGCKVENWAAMLVETCKILKDLDENTFLKFIKDSDFKVMNRCYFSFSKEHIKEPESINLKNRKLYIETDLSDNVINKLIQKLINTYNIGEENFKIYLKEANTG